MLAGWRTCRWSRQVWTLSTFFITTWAVLQEAAKRLANRVFASRKKCTAALLQDFGGKYRLLPFCPDSLWTIPQLRLPRHIQLAVKMPRNLRPPYFRSLSSFSKDKPRLYIALYPRGGEAASSTSVAHCDSYHWALIIGSACPSRKDPATRYHLKHTSGHSPLDSRRGSEHAFFLEEGDLVDDPRAQEALLVRVAVAKISNLERTTTILQSMRPYGKDRTHYSCFNWVQEAFIALHSEPGCLKSFFNGSDWAWVEKCTREYCKSKRQQGRFNDNGIGRWNREEVSTFNAWEKRETTP
jgi:hypothetical protein